MSELNELEFIEQWERDFEEAVKRAEAALKLYTKHALSRQKALRYGRCLPHRKGQFRPIIHPREKIM